MSDAYNAPIFTDGNAAQSAAEQLEARAKRELVAAKATSAPSA